MSIKPSQAKLLKTEMVVGVFFAIALCILGYFTIILSPEAAFGERFEIIATFTDKPHPKKEGEVIPGSVGNLKIGANVRTKGVVIGRVTDIDISDDYKAVNVTLRLTQKPDLYDGCKATVESTSFLGGEYLKIHVGNPRGAKYPEGEWIPGETNKALMENANEIVEKINKELDEGEILKNLAETLDNLKNSSTQMNEFFVQLKREDSTLGQLVNIPDERLKKLDKLFETFEQAGLSIKEAGQEVSSAGQKVKSSADELEKFGKSINQIVADAKSGKGLLGKVISEENGQKVWDDLEKAITNLTEFSKKLNNKESTLGKLLSDDDVYNTFKDTLSNLYEISDKINNGEGTLAMLINDAEAYEDLRAILKDGKKTLDEVQHAIQDFREQAPISTFGGIIFGTL